MNDKDSDAMDLQIVSEVFPDGELMRVSQHKLKLYNKRIRDAVLQEVAASGEAVAYLDIGEDGYCDMGSSSDEGELRNAVGVGHHSLYLHPAVPDPRIAEHASLVEICKLANDKLAELQAKLDALIPEGHVVVPVEPTKEMMLKGYQKITTAIECNDGDLYDVYKAMIASAQEAKHKRTLSSVFDKVNSAAQTSKEKRG